MSRARLHDRERVLLAVIRCGIDQGMRASYFGDEEARIVRRMARRGIVKILGTERDQDVVWTLATIA